MTRSIFSKAALNLSGLVLAAALVLPGVAGASGISVDILPNFVGLGVGATTEWSGSRDSMVGVVPAARVQWDNKRYVEWYALYAGVNLIDSGGWEFGPAGMYRLGRKDVADEIVKKLPEISSAFDLGVFGGYSYLNTQGIPFRVRLGLLATTTVTGESGDTNITPYVTTWVPLSPTVFVGLGVGATWASSTYMQRYYGITPAAGAASGLPSYTPGAGIRQVYAWPALMVKLNENWYLGGGAYYQRLTDGASNSPIIEQRGSSNQWTYGLGAAYAWK